MSAQRQGVNGLHVHVGVESADRCWERLEAVLPWLPVVLALSANSPFVDGEPTGMLSNRAAILAELPRGGAPPGFADYAEWEAWVERLVAARRDAGLHARLVGRSPASEARHARGAHRRPADVARAHGAHRRARARARRDGAAVERAARRLSAEPLGGRALRASMRRCSIRTANALSSARELARELLGAEPPEPEALAQLAAQNVAADLVARTVA